LDINAIENSIANKLYLNRYSLYPRLYELFWEFDNYKRGANPSGHSVIQRMFYLEAGWNIFLEKPLLGVGVGDVKSSYSEYYNKTNSPLTPRWRLRAHNQFLTVLLSFGILGFIIFIISQFYPAYTSQKAKKLSKLFIPFVIISLLSMLNEDTLETQAGVTFYAFFYALFVWGINHKKSNEHESE
jgi:O-antigen ligase